jgi:hypothetical protein
MNFTEARDIARDVDAIKRDPFAAAKAIAWTIAQPDSPAVHDVVLHALEHRAEFGPAREILDAAVRELGLFPYLQQQSLSSADQIAYEFHKPRGLPRVVFHRAQARVFRDLMRGENVVLSAPTSFGKSLLIDAIVASGEYQQIVIVVPTLALIDETRRRLSAFGKTYKIVTHSLQAAADRAIYILTQERVVDREFRRVDFFVIDEFYKLSPDREDGERAAILNQAFYKLKKLGGRFLLIGPAIREVQATEAVTFKFVHETFTTVTSELHNVSAGPDEMTALRQLVRRLEGQTIVFCSSPNRAAQVSEALAEGLTATKDRRLTDAVNWLGSNYHPRWHFAQAMRHGVGVHHGRIPRALGQFVVRAFNEGLVKTLVCTSTLIEGVNTKARNIVILDNRISLQPFDYFTFNNIRGRGGRMLQHFVGHIYLFHDQPQQMLPIIEFPAFTQSDAASDSLLLQLEEDDLTHKSSGRLQKYRDQRLLPLSVLRANAGLDPNQQIEFAQDIVEHLDEYYPLLAWRGFPNWDQTVFIAECMWRHFGAQRLGAGSARSAKQLALRIRKLSQRQPLTALIRQEREVEVNPDAAVQSVLDFVRLWATFHFPRLLRAMERIQRHVYEGAGAKPGIYGAYAAQVESLFLGPHVVPLEEYGIPIEVGRKLIRFVDDRKSLDEAIQIVRRIPVERVTTDPFEQEVLRDAQQSM